MSALHELGATNGTRVDVRLLGPFFWDWFHRHAGDRILKRRILIFSVTIHVRDLAPLFVALFGPEPENTGIVG